MISHRAIIFFVPMPMTGTPSFYLCSRFSNNIISNNYEN
jgi:hypothetical protein